MCLKTVYRKNFGLEGYQEVSSHSTRLSNAYFFSFNYLVTIKIVPNSIFYDNIARFIEWKRIQFHAEIGYNHLVSEVKT